MPSISEPKADTGSTDLADQTTIPDAGQSQIADAQSNQQPPLPPPPTFPPPPTQPFSTQNANTGTGAVVGDNNSGDLGTCNLPPQPQSLQQQQQPSPNQQGQGNGAVLDSLSLAQLRKLASEFSRNEPVTYDFDYGDMGTLDEEIDEWFSYQIWQWVRLNYAHQHFTTRWQRFATEQGLNSNNSSSSSSSISTSTTGWDDVDAAVREEFVRKTLAVVAEGPYAELAEAVGTLLYLVLGRWASTAVDCEVLDAKRSPQARTVACQAQLDAIKAGAALVARADGVSIVWKALRDAFEPFWGPGDPQQMLPMAVFQDAQDDLSNLMTLFYAMMQTALSDPIGQDALYKQLVTLKPPLPDFFMNVISHMRWDDNSFIPQTQVFLLLWKSLLLVFGGTKELEQTKKATAESSVEEDKERNLIMASPLEYNAFRQEITSKYPAYVPPQPVLPLEDDTSTLLPTVPNTSSRNQNNGVLPSSANAHASILHQTVHIATPAPSPPPSPAVGGKGTKKQNYQTNQNFPFMYPPLDITSNGVGGKGAAALRDALVGRKWEGSDVPSSILEAGELFSTRVRMTRATRQLWDERENFLKSERGWAAEDDDFIEELDLSSLTMAEKEELGLVKPTEVEQEAKRDELDVDYGPHPDRLDERVKQRLGALEDFYREALPHLQSLVIVLLKAILINVAVLISQPPPGQQQHPAAGGPNGRGYPLSNNPPAHEPIELSADELDAARTREINAKAVSGILLLLLKWLKVSHVLKFEYLAQLLLDCNYVPLLLKLWAHQDVHQLIESKTDRTENSFFYYCNVRASETRKQTKMPNEAQKQEGDHTVEDFSQDESEDDAVPPPIERHRPIPAQTTPALDEDGDLGTGASAAQPELDEFGDPVTTQSITDFNRRNFFALINLLRVMQKICKNKVHRNLLLVHYKSSNILRKMLKVPHPALRLYTLKLFKNQVPYCGRKWRQGNMRVITAVYLHCRPELRDEWLAGSDVDAEVESSLPLEQALRSLTHWFNVRRYPDKMAPEVHMALREEHDFFVRELEKLDLHWAELGEGESVASEWGEC